VGREWHLEEVVDTNFGHGGSKKALRGAIHAG
jgi:hypothetical protein